jgi:hypothetical protein
MRLWDEIWDFREDRRPDWNLADLTVAVLAAVAIGLVIAYAVL